MEHGGAKMRQLINWDDIKMFLALVRSGSVRSAATQLDVSHSTVARRVEAMEQRLSVRLFERLPDGYSVTAAGEDMLNVAESVENDLSRLERRILGRDLELAGQIRLTMVDFLAKSPLISPLVEFGKKYPRIDLELNVTYSVMDLDKREADIALRFGSNPPEHLFGRRLLTVATAAYASTEYIELNDLETSKTSRWIGFGPPNPTPKWAKESAFPHIPVRGNIASILAQLEACKVGMGLGMLPCFLGDVEPSLQRLSPPEFTPNFELWLLTHGDLRSTARFRVFSEYLAKTIRDHRAAFEGH